MGNLLLRGAAQVSGRHFMKTKNAPRAIRAKPDPIKAHDYNLLPTLHRLD